MDLRLNHSNFPNDILNAINKIQVFIAVQARWKEIWITANEGLFCVSKTGTTLSPPSAGDEESSDDRERILIKRKATVSAKQNTEYQKWWRLLKKAKWTNKVNKTLQQIGVALRWAQDTVPGQNSEPTNSTRTYSKLYEHTTNTTSKDAIVENYLFSKKLRYDEQIQHNKTEKGREIVIARLVKKALTGREEDQKRNNTVKEAYQIYDITSHLTPNQIRHLQEVSKWDLTQIRKDEIHFLCEMCL